MANICCWSDEANDSRRQQWSNNGSYVDMEVNVENLKFVLLQRLISVIFTRILHDLFC